MKILLGLTVLLIVAINYALFRAKNKSNISERGWGVIHDGKRERFMSPEEYDYWLNHPLPFGWAIIAKPYPLFRAEGREDEPDDSDKAGA